MLGRRRPDGSPIIKVDQLRDGIVLFEDLGSAEQFSNYLEADKNSEVSFGGARILVLSGNNCIFEALSAFQSCMTSHILLRSVSQLSRSTLFFFPSHPNSGSISVLYNTTSVMARVVRISKAAMLGRGKTMNNMVFVCRFL